MRNADSLKLLNLGCGLRVVEGWVNVDFVSSLPDVHECNLLEGIPFHDDAFDAVYHSHLLEHFTAEQGNLFLHQCFRVLKPGGIVRVAVPDLEKIAQVYLEELRRATAGEPLAAENHNWMVVELLDQCTRHESGGEMRRLLERDSIINWDFIKARLGVEVTHLRDVLMGRKLENSPAHSPRPSYRSRLIAKAKTWLLAQLDSDPELEQIGRFRVSGEVHRWMYDRFSLEQSLRQAGFVDVEKVDAFSSRIPDWECHQELDVENAKTRKPDSLFMEARKARA